MKTIHDWVDQLICGDALQVLPEMPSEFVDAVVTDPPYFLDKLDNQWSLEQVEKRLPSQRVITHLPPGMKFDPNQGREFYRWFLKVAQELLRILKPGGFFFCFSSPRLYHRLAAAVEDAGFWIRDSFIWLYLQNQPKAMGLDHFIERLPVSEAVKQQLKAKLRGWKTPQVKSCYEPIVVAQKPYEGTLLENMLKHQVGLFNTEVRIGSNMYPANVLIVDSFGAMLDRYFLVPKPDVQEKGAYNTHPSVKPVALCEHLIRLSTLPQAIVLDPFIGSGTTAIAARSTGRHFIGVDINPEYIAIAQRRLSEWSPSLFQEDAP
ncbi:MAG: site-specific DNA-methyltransferase [Armatimonadetes bacterium]|nr:site-specific DNA-methyltransferase [Armatimonadota bacterium]